MIWANLLHLAYNMWWDHGSPLRPKLSPHPVAQPYLRFDDGLWHDLWWHDLYFLVEQVENANVRAWVWSDYDLNQPQEFFARMPKSVLQSNWYYDDKFENIDNDLQRRYVQAYDELEEHGYDQLPTGSNGTGPHNMELTVEFLRDRIVPERLFGFMTAPWHPTLDQYREHHTAAIAQLGAEAKGRNSTV